MRLLVLVVLVMLAASLALATGSSRAEGPNAVIDLAGCTANTLPDNDDGSTGIVGMGFPINFFGQTYDSLYVNNNGNVTFNRALSAYVPFSITSATEPMIAAFFTDIDTRGRTNGALDVTYGQASYNGHNAFCVNWVNVGEFSHRYDALNSAQLLLVDQGQGNFDILLNYDKIGFDHGGAGIGYTNGSGDPNTFYELPGSRVGGAFRDSSPGGLVHSSLGTAQLGRYLFQVRGGALPVGGQINGTVTLASGGAPVAGAPIQACPTAGGRCRISVSNALGGYSVSGLPTNSYTVTASAPAASSLLPVSATTTLTAPGSATVNLSMSGPTPPPPGTSITNIGSSAGVPTVYWNDALTLTTSGCAGATATFQIVVGGAVVRNGPMTESVAGSYTGHSTSLYPAHGAGQVSFHIICPGGAFTDPAFNIYIDPSGTVSDTLGNPIPGATVTLFRSDTDTGPFVVVPNGSALMAPANRVNPDVTDAVGHFGWDVVAGFYVVRAEAPGCHDPADTSVTFVETAVLDIPPPVTNLSLVLACGVAGVGSPPPPEVWSADVGVVQSVSPAALKVGQVATVRLDVTNHGPGRSTDVMLGDVVPAGLTILDVSSDAGSCSSAAGILACSVHRLHAGDSWHVTMRVRADSPGARTLDASVGALEADPNVGDNNYSHSTISVLDKPGIVGPGNGAFAPPLQAVRKGGSAKLTTTFSLDGAATIRIVALNGRGKAVKLLPGSAAGAVTGSGYTLDGPAGPGETSVSLNLRPRALKHGGRYTLVVIATNEAGSSRMDIPFLG